MRPLGSSRSRAATSCQRSPTISALRPTTCARPGETKRKRSAASVCQRKRTGLRDNSCATRPAMTERAGAPVSGSVRFAVRRRASAGAREARGGRGRTASASRARSRRVASAAASRRRSIAAAVHRARALRPRGARSTASARSLTPALIDLTGGIELRRRAASRAQAPLGVSRVLDEVEAQLSVRIGELEVTRGRRDRRGSAGRALRRRASPAAFENRDVGLGAGEERGERRERRRVASGLERLRPERRARRRRRDSAAAAGGRQRQRDRRSSRSRASVPCSGSARARLAIARRSGWVSGQRRSAKRVEGRCAERLPPAGLAQSTRLPSRDQIQAGLGGEKQRPRLRERAERQERCPARIHRNGHLPRAAAWLMNRYGRDEEIGPALRGAYHRYSSGLVNCSDGLGRRNGALQNLCCNAQ